MINWLFHEPRCLALLKYYTFFLEIRTNIFLKQKAAIHLVMYDDKLVRWNVTIITVSTNGNLKIHQLQPMYLKYIFNVLLCKLLLLE